MAEQTNPPWPPFLAPLREALETLHLPEGPFDPHGAWEHRYAVHVLGPQRMAAGEHPHPYGTLTLKRTPADANRFVLEVDMSTAARSGSGLRTRATITCAADHLATPQHWELKSDILSNGQPVELVSTKESGETQSGVITRRGQKERKLTLEGPFTSNFSLLEAVQRLPLHGLEPLAFDMLENLDQIKAGQRLASIGPVTLQLGSRPVRLHGFRQIGRGILPTHYWLDDQHRLIAVAGSLRGFIWDDGAPAPWKKQGKENV